MLWLPFFILAGYALFLPLTLTVQVQHHRRTRTCVTLHFLCFRKTWRFSGLAWVTSPLRRNPNSRLRFSWRRAVGARRFLRQHTSFVHLDATILLHTGDAARTALYTGALRSVISLFPSRSRRICIQPDFFRGHSALQARCIIRWKLGTLLLTAWMLLTEALFRQQLKESEARS